MKSAVLNVKESNVYFNNIFNLVGSIIIHNIIMEHAWDRGENCKTIYFIHNMKLLCLF